MDRALELQRGRGPDRRRRQRHGAVHRECRLGATRQSLSDVDGPAVTGPSRAGFALHNYGFGVDDACAGLYLSAPSNGSSPAMLRSRFLALPFALSLSLALPLAGQYKPKYTVEQFLSPPFPLVFASAQNADRIAWVGYDRGRRNVFTAAAPTFTPVKLTHFDTDDGQDITAVDVSDDGSTVVFVRGSNPNGLGWIANPSHDPAGAERAIWAVSATSGTAVHLVEGSGPQVSPD